MVTNKRLIGCVDLHLNSTYSDGTLPPEASSCHHVPRGALAVNPASTRNGRERVVITVRAGAATRDVDFMVVARRPELVLRRLDEKLDYHFPAETAARLLELKSAPPSASGDRAAPE